MCIPGLLIKTLKLKVMFHRLILIMFWTTNWVSVAPRVMYIEIFSFEKNSNKILCVKIQCHIRGSSYNFRFPPLVSCSLPWIIYLLSLGHRIQCFKFWFISFCFITIYLQLTNRSCKDTISWERREEPLRSALPVQYQQNLCSMLLKLLLSDYLR